MEPLTLQTVAEYAGGTLRQGVAASIVSAVVTDTRSLEPGQLFVALTGENFDGHHFLGQAEKAGALGAMVATKAGRPEVSPSFALLEVENTLLGYQRLASAYRRQLPLRVVAITGSNGKTSTKDFTAAVLGQRFKVLKTEGNLNNHIGVPRMLLRVSASEEIAVLEMGMNHPGEIQPLAEMAKPDVAIITNIGTAHIEFMKSREAIAQEKGMLVEAIGPQGCVILPAEDDFAESLAARTSARVITVGLRKGEVRAANIERNLEGSRFDIIYEGARTAASVAVPGDHMITNALLAAAAGLAVGMSLEDSARGLAAASLTKGRLQVRQVGGLQIIDDSYNANPDSMVAALTTLASLPAAGRRIAVLGRMAELGSESEPGHQRVGCVAADAGFDVVVTVGDEAAIIARRATECGVPQVHAVGTTEEAAELLREMARPDDLVLVKGSRSAGMERVIASLLAFREAPTPAQPSTLN